MKMEISYKGVTVAQLKKMCENEIKKGNGDKHIIISDDDELNGTHTLFNGFTSSIADLQYIVADDHDEHDASEVVLLS